MRAQTDTTSEATNAPTGEAASIDVERPTLICNLERIAFGAVNDDEPAVHLGLNLATGLKVGTGVSGDPALDLSRCLRPWAWPDDGGLPAFEVLLYHWPKEGNELLPLTMRKGPSDVLFDTHLEPAVELRSDLQGTIAKLDGQLSAWLAGDGEHKKLHWRRDVEYDEGSPKPVELDGRWPVRLGELSQLPFPLPQLLGLCGRLRIPATELPDDGHLYVVPLLPGALGGEKVEMASLVIEPAPPAGKDMPQRFEYVLLVEEEEASGEDADGAEAEPTTRRIVLASTYCNPLDLEAKASDLWIKNLQFYGEDWRSRLEQRLTEGLFLAPTFVEWQAAKWQAAEKKRRAGDTVEAANEPLPAGLVHRILGGLLSIYLDEEESRLPGRGPSELSAGAFAFWRREIDRIAEHLVEAGSDAAKRFGPEPEQGPGGVLKTIRELLVMGVKVSDAVEHAVERFLRKATIAGVDDPRIVGWIAEVQGDLVARLVPEADSPLGVEDAEQTEGITLRLAALAADCEKIEPESEPEARPIADDEARNSRGVVVLARKASEGDWQCLNWGVPFFRHLGKASRKPVLLPARLSYANGLSQPTMTYDNAPLSVPGPLDKLGWELKCSTDCTKSGRDDLITFDCRPGSKIPGLEFGETYRFACFHVSNSGALPVEAQSTDSPWLLDEGLNDVRHDEASLPYLRRVKVGAIRVQASETISTPPFGAPPGVTPWLERPPLDSEKAPEVNRPLLFLHRDLGSHRKRETAAFELRRPDLDWRTWERWPDPKVRELRARVLSEYLCGVYQGREDLELDDPAVTGFEVVVEDLDESEGRRVVYREDLALNPLPARAAGTLPEEVGLQPSLLKVELTDELGFKPGGEGATHELTICLVPGGAYRVTVRCQIEGSEDYFAEDPRKKTDEHPEGRLPTWELDIEVAEPLLKEVGKGQDSEEAVAGQVLWQAIESDFHEATGVLRCGVDVERLPLNGPLGQRLRRQVLQAEVLRQSWAWRGRPLTGGHPDLGGAGGAAPAEAEEELVRYLEWEVSEMGFRGNDNHAVYPMKRDPQALRFEFTDSLGTGPGREGDRRAGHHRFAVRLISRYRALFGDRPSSVVSRHDESRTLWRRRFVPCRWHGEVPPPKVRAVLPLTEDRSSAGDGPRFLVLLDEGWHQIGGLTERLEAELVELTLPTEAAGWGKAREADCEQFLEQHPPSAVEETDDEPPSGHEKLPVMGPDPIVFKGGYAESDVVEIDVEPAVGHSHEIDAPLPRITASSFIVHPKLAGTDLSWWFLKVRFRRVIVVDGEPLRSEPTQAYWIQLLPSFRLHGSEEPEMTARLEKDGRVQVYSSTSRNAPAGESERLIHFLLLTRRVTDALGQDQEIYLGLLHGGDGAFTAESALTPVLEAVADRRGLQVRRLEVQQGLSKQITTSDELWLQLFGPPDSDDSEDAGARIVRISDPMPLLNATVEVNR